MIVPYAVAEIQICESCGYEFSTDEARKCFSCYAYICPKCKNCNCIFGVPPLLTVIGIGYGFKSD